MHDSLSEKEGDPRPTTRARQNEVTAKEGGEGGEKDDILGRLNDLDVTWGIDLRACLQERAQAVSVAGDAGDGTAETIDSSQGSAIDASSVPTERAKSNSGASAASGTDQGSGDDLPVVLVRRDAYKLSSWRRLPPTVLGRTRSQRQHLEGVCTQRLLRMQREVKDALYAAVQE